MFRYIGRYGFLLLDYILWHNIDMYIHDKQVTKYNNE